MRMATSSRSRIIVLNLYRLAAISLAMSWTVQLHPEMAEEFQELSESVQDAIAAHVRLLETMGPTLHRPAADTLAGSKIANLKELRFNANDGVWRVAFAFDGNRIGVLLVAGDKKGQNQKRFYKTLIATAERRWSTWS